MEKRKIDAFVERKINIAKKTAEKAGVTFICSEYKKIGTEKAVRVRIPDLEDNHWVKMDSFQAVTLNNHTKVVTIPSYDRCGRKFNTVFVTRNYFGVGCHNYNLNVVADIDFIKKIDYSSGFPREDIVMDIHICNDQSVVPLVELKMNTETGEYLIPGTEKFLQLKPIVSINKREKPVLILKPKVAAVVAR